MSEALYSNNFETLKKDGILQGTISPGQKNLQIQLRSIGVG